jgi:hypothetical protein
MATISQTLVPEEAQYLATNFPQFRTDISGSIVVSGLAFDATTDEAAFWKFIAVGYGSGNLTLTIYWRGETGVTSGNVVWEAQLAVVTPDADTQDVITDTPATLNFVQDTHLGTTARRLMQCVITISNLDSLAANDYVTIRIARDANGTNATDDLAGDAVFLAATIAYSDT